MISPAQIKAARALAEMTQAELAQVAGLSATALGAIESGASDPKVSTMARVIAALEAKGVVFGADGSVRLREAS
jgi:DNA-binding XRE family transcriptional regulator